MAGEPPPEPTSNQLPAGICHIAGQPPMARSAADRTFRQWARRKGRAVRLIFAFHCASSRKYASSCSLRVGRYRHAGVCSSRRQPRLEIRWRSHGVAADVGREDGDRGRSDSWNSQRVTQRVRPYLRQPLDDLLRQAGNALERKIRRNSPPLVLPRALDLALLAPKIARVLDRRLDRRDVDRGGRAGRASKSGSRRSAIRSLSRISG